MVKCLNRYIILIQVCAQINLQGISDTGHCDPKIEIYHHRNDQILSLKNKSANTCTLFL